MIELIEIIVGLVSFVVAIKALVTLVLLALLFAICFPFALMNDSKKAMNESIDESRKLLREIELEYERERLTGSNEKNH